MVVPAHPYWRRKLPSQKTRDAVWQALHAGPMNSMDVAGEAKLAWKRTCAALDALLIAGRVERLETGQYRRVE